MYRWLDGLSIIFGNNNKPFNTAYYFTERYSLFLLNTLM
ncbi:hypothetical protein PAUR_a2424 [Pseudoalteromonas aurantia 208]|uniref:Uncharacterized protein n=1 Tax=Pseudoalteromonas aurantia 208 TaxID=1314867 RepID=A0ABR9ECM4_9GAMM|nr:hypothetical protein [Pseudoalteromonas aurantia 208]